MADRGHGSKNDSIFMSGHRKSGKLGICKFQDQICKRLYFQVGVIEVVYDAKTVYQIQRQASRLAAIQVARNFNQT